MKINVFKRRNVFSKFEYISKSNKNKKENIVRYKFIICYVQSVNTIKF